MIDRAKSEKGEGLATLSLWELRDVYAAWHRGWPKKLAAEVAFALAVGIKRSAESMGPGFADKKKKYLGMARGYAAECVVLLTGLPAGTMKDISPAHPSLAKIAMPNYFYLSYIRDHNRFPEFTELLS